MTMDPDFERLVVEKIVLSAGNLTAFASGFSPQRVPALLELGEKFLKDNRLDEAQLVGEACEELESSSNGGFILSTRARLGKGMTEFLGLVPGRFVDRPPAPHESRAALLAFLAWISGEDISPKVVDGLIAARLQCGPNEEEAAYLRLASMYLALERGDGAAVSKALDWWRPLVWPLLLFRKLIVRPSKQ